MTEYYRSGGIPPWQTDGVPTYINGAPNSPDPGANPYDSQPRAPYMSQLHRIQLLPSSGGESPVLSPRAPATLSQVNLLGSEGPTAITSPVQRLLEVSQPPVLPSAEMLT